jgi:hypothetical protein
MGKSQGVSALLHLEIGVHRTKISVTGEDCA